MMYGTMVNGARAAQRCTFAFLFFFSIYCRGFHFRRLNKLILTGIILGLSISKS